MSHQFIEHLGIWIAAGPSRRFIVDGDQAREPKFRVTLSSDSKQVLGEGATPNEAIQRALHNWVES